MIDDVPKIRNCSIANYLEQDDVAGEEADLDDGNVIFDEIFRAGSFRATMF